MAAIDVAFESTQLQEPALAERPYSMLEAVNLYNGFRVGGDNDIQSMVEKALGRENEVKLAPPNLEISQSQIITVEPLEPTVLVDRVKLIETDQPEEVNELSVQPDRQVVSGLKTFIKGSWNKTHNLLTSQEHKTFRKRAARTAIGAVAIVGAAVAARYGLNAFNTVQKTQEHTNDLHNNLSASGLHSEQIESAPKLLHNIKTAHAIGVAAVKASHETLKQHLSTAVNIVHGGGYTQAIKERFAGHTPEQYYAAYKETLRHFGPGFIRGVGHYKNGTDYGLMPGKGHFTQESANFLQNYFKHTK